MSLAESKTRAEAKAREAAAEIVEPYVDDEFKDSHFELTAAIAAALEEAHLAGRRAGMLEVSDYLNKWLDAAEYQPKGKP